MEQCNSFDNEDQEADRVILNVSGVRFETYVTTLQNIADTRLAWLIENVEEETLKEREFFFDRHPGAFIHILNFYRTGKLHTPTDMCGPAFEEELQFWGIDEKQMEPCCWETFTKHREAETNLRTFEGPGFEDLQVMRSRKYSNFSTFDEESFLKRNMRAMWALLNDPHSSDLAKRFSLLSCGMIIISLSVYCLLTMPSLKEDSVLTWINQICLTFFTIEFILRVIACPRKSQFVRDYQNWIDFLSIIPSYLMIAFPEKKWIYNLVIIRLLRVFKFFKLSYGLQVLLHTLKASSYELTLLLLILLIPLVVFSSLVYAVEYNMTNGNTDFDSIPRTFWWAIVTMTTVGYGDLAPKTWAGQTVGSICAIISVLIIALPISVIGNNFNLYYAHVRARLKLPKKNRHLLQGRLRGLLRQPAMLSSRDRDRKNITRRSGNSGNAGLVPSDGRLTVDHVLAPSPYIQLRRRAAPVPDEVSVNTSHTENESESETIESKEQSNMNRKGSQSKEDVQTDQRDSVVSTSLSQFAEDSEATENENDKILNNFLSNDNEKCDNKNSKDIKCKPNGENASDRKRKTNKNAQLLNGFPTRARRAAVGLPVSLLNESSNDTLGSSDSIILPSVTVPTSNYFSRKKSSASVESEQRSSPDLREDSNIRRHSMKMITDYKSKSITEIQPPASILKRTYTNQSSLSMSSHSTRNSTPSGLDSNESCTPLLLEKSCNNNFIIPELNKNNHDGVGPRKKSSIGIRGRPLKRSYTDNGFFNQNKESTNLEHHNSLSIDDIMRIHHRQNGDNKYLFLRESGV